MRFRLGCGAGLAGVLALAAPALAQSNDDAQAAFASAEDAFQRNDYVLALAEFRRAFAADPRDAVRFNIGVCLERLGRYKEAVAEFDVVAKSSELPEEKRARGKEEAAKARARLGTLSVRSDQPGSDLYVDGEFACRLPCEVALDPRVHRVQVENAGRERSRTLSITSGERRSTELLLGAPPAPTSTAGTKPERPLRDEGSRFQPGVLGWTGAGLAVVGGAGFVGFGLRARDLEREYAEAPTRSTRDDGLRMQTLTNVSLGVALTGVALLAVDLFVLGHARRKATSASAQAVTFE